MLLAGGIEATVTLPSGEYVTVKVRTRKRQGSGWTNATPGEEGALTTASAFGWRVGRVEVANDGGWVLTRQTTNMNVQAALDALFDEAAGVRLAAGHRVQVADRCGRCLRRLTDPVSIDRGIGPECFGRETGSRAADTRAEDVLSNAPVTLTADSAGTSVAITATTPSPSTNVWPQPDAAFGASAFVRGSNAATATSGLVDLAETARAFREVGRASAALTERHLSRNTQRARDLIAEALDAYCGTRDRDFAMGIFDELAAGDRS
jgi:hypothetical protein